MYLSIGDITLEANLTNILISDSPRRMGQKQINFEAMPARLPDGTLGRIDAVLAPKEKRSDFLRAAVEAELKRRERAKPKPPAS